MTESPEFNALLNFRRLRDAKLNTIYQMIILLAIKLDPEITTTDLAKSLNSSRAGASHQTHHLRKKGFLDWRLRTEDEARRQRYGRTHTRRYFLTETGEALVSFAAQIPFPPDAVTP